MARCARFTVAIWLLNAVVLLASDRPSAAAGDDHWAYAPMSRSTPPAIDDGLWRSSPIDAFIYRQLDRHGLAPVEPADRRTLIRRATFDLVGLPPTPKEVAAFLADDSPDAFGRVIDRLLASPQYGVRWGRHWLDIARYADTNGLDENKPFENAYRYRDYVIDAFNRDMPYDQFVREQLAGDLLADRGDNRVAQRLTATGFLVIGAKVLAEPDAAKMNMDIVDEQLDVMGKAFIAQSLGCARCHDHKFDPISTSDYYGLAGIFKSTEAMLHYINVAEWRERELASEQAIARRAAHVEQLERAHAELDRLATAAQAPLVRGWQRQLGVYLQVATELARLVEPREAEDFNASNLRIKRGGDEGQGIGVVYRNHADDRPFVEWKVQLPREGAYRFDIRYASIDERPLTLSINGRQVAAGVAGEALDEEIAFAHFQRWEEVGVFPFKQGTNLIRLEGVSSFPYVDQFALIPTSRDALYTRRRRELAGGRPLVGAVVDNWIRFIHQTKRTRDPIFAIWHALADRWAASRDEQRRPPGERFGELVVGLRSEIQRGRLAVEPVTLHLLRGRPPRSLDELAQRYQQLFAAVAWSEMAFASLGETEEETRRGEAVAVRLWPLLADLREEDLRDVLYSERGPFTFPTSAEQLLEPSTRNELAALRHRIEQLESTLPAEFPRAMAVAEGRAGDLPIHVRGDPGQLDEVPVPRRPPRVLDRVVPTFTVQSGESGRRELAAWLVHPEHPLTARVIVNRLWHWHFGTGIVASPSNFGLRGEKPTHPELLDWLARTLTGEGWSLKRVQRRIMLSRTFQLGNQYHAANATRDPESRYHWRSNVRRLEAEAIRDAIFFMGNQLDLRLGGGFRGMSGGEYVRDMSPEYRWPRRAVFLPVVRINMNPMLAAFDYADPTVPLARRPSTVVVPQALLLLNSPLVHRQARRFAESLLRIDGDDRRRVKAAYEKAYSRPPSADEESDAIAFLDRMRQHHAGLDSEPVAERESPLGPLERSELYAWTKFCHTVIASSEFLYVN